MERKDNYTTITTVVDEDGVVIPKELWSQYSITISTTKS
jgi:hypothetical protein